jgi:hypothetical protein
MKKNFFSVITAFAWCMVVINFSCSKNVVTQPIPIPPPHGSGPAVHPGGTDTVQVEDYQWEVSPAGYRSDLRPFANGMSIIDVFVSYNGTDFRVSPGKTIDFYGGYLQNSGIELTFYTPYNEKPFHSLGLTLIVTK